MEEKATRVNSAEEMFEAMDGITKQRKHYLEIVKEYLTRKHRTPYYETFYEDRWENPYEYLKPLDEEDMADLLATAHKLDPDDEYDIDCTINDSPEEFREKPYFYQICPSLQEEIYFTGINLDKTYYTYRFTVAHFEHGIEEKPTIFPFRISLTDEEYIYLTAEFMVYPDLTLAKLRTKNPKLFGEISNVVEGHFHHNSYLTPVPLYLVEFSEIKEDAERLLNSVESKIY